MSAIVDMIKVIEIEQRLLQGSSMIDRAWISYELDVPLDAVNEVVDSLCRDASRAVGYNQSRDAMMA